MTLSAASFIGLGGVLSIGTQGGSPTYTAIAGIKQIKPPSPKFATEDVTPLAAANSQRQFLKTLQDLGEMDVTAFWQSADPGQQAVVTAYGVVSNSTNGASFPFKMALPINLPGGQATTGDTWVFNALVTDYSLPELQPDKTNMWSFKLKLTGPTASTYTEGS